MWPSPVTRSPTLMLRTPAPTSATMPTYSWPMVMGVLMVFWLHSSHLYMCRSVPQMAVFLILMSTSFTPTSGTGTSSIQMPFMGSFFTNAFMNVSIGVGWVQRFLHKITAFFIANRPSPQVFSTFFKRGLRCGTFPSSAAGARLKPRCRPTCAALARSGEKTYLCGQIAVYILI